MGSPLYGTVFGTMNVAPAPRLPGSDNTIAAICGAILWIVIHGGLAAILFAATLATFDRCLGRISETAERPMPRFRKKPVAQLDILYLDD